MSGSAFAVTHHAFSSGAGRTSDGNGSHASTLKSPSYTKSVSWQHHHAMRNIFNGMMTTTSPASFETATRTGVVGGSFSYRTTNVNTNLVSMSFPKASVGCNGIDVFLGSFSMITGKCCVRHNRNGEKNGDANQAEKGVSAVTEG